MVHETTWHFRAARTSSPKCLGASGTGVEHKRCRPTRRHFLCLCLSVEDGCPNGRVGRHKSQTCSGAPAQNERTGPESLIRFASEGRLGLRLSQRPLDFKENCVGNSKRIRGAVSPQSYLADPARRGVVLPGSRAACHSTRREGHRTLEALQVAAYKKKPKDLGPILFSWMKAASCLSPHAVARGGRGVARRSSTTVTSMIASRHWLRFPYRPSTNTWACTCAFSRTISRPWTRHSFCVNCCNIFAVRSFCFGIADAYTRARSSQKCSRIIRVYRLSGFPSMLPNSLLSHHKSKRVNWLQESLSEFCASISVSA